MKERKKISWPIAQYNNKIEHTIGLSEYAGIRKMLNIKYKGKVPSKAVVAVPWNEPMNYDFKNTSEMFKAIFKKIS